MEPAVAVQVVNHQGQVALGDWPDRLEELAPAALAAAWNARTADHVPLALIRELDVALVDDAAIGEVHGRFLGDPSPTDVITFDHGEILIGVEAAVRQVAEHHEPLGRELLRYLVHGLLHLAGHQDADQASRQRMVQAQERIVMELDRGGETGDCLSGFNR